MKQTSINRWPGQAQLILTVCEKGEKLELSLSWSALRQSAPRRVHSGTNSTLFLGGVVDVGKLIGQLSKSEKSRAEMEQQLADAVKTLNDVKEVSNKHSSSKDKLLASGVLFASAEGLRSF